MTRLVLFSCLLGLLLTGGAVGQEVEPISPLDTTQVAAPNNLGPIQPQAGLAPAPVFHGSLSTGQITPTPEMWFYEQENRRWDDPKQAVRRAAEQRAAQRTARISAMKWYGYSNQRPVASPVPFMGTYSPGWTGNSSDGYRWVGHGSGGGVIIQAERAELYR